jgi:hypothetical protein
MNATGTTSALRGLGVAAGPSASRLGFGTVPFPTRADFRVRLEAIGSGRWVSHLTGARVTVGAGRPRRSVPA